MEYKHTKKYINDYVDEEPLFEEEDEKVRKNAETKAQKCVGEYVDNVTVRMPEYIEEYFAKEEDIRIGGMVKFSNDIVISHTPRKLEKVDEEDKEEEESLTPKQLYFDAPVPSSIVEIPVLEDKDIASMRGAEIEQIRVSMNSIQERMEAFKRNMMWGEAWMNHLLQEEERQKQE